MTTALTAAHTTQLATLTQARPTPTQATQATQATPYLHHTLDIHQARPLTHTHQRQPRRRTRQLKEASQVKMQRKQRRPNQALDIPAQGMDRALQHTQATQAAVPQHLHMRPALTAMLLQRRVNCLRMLSFLAPSLSPPLQLVTPKPLLHIRTILFPHTATPTSP
jgi:hypothetical protein